MKNSKENQSASSLNFLLRFIVAMLTLALIGGFYYMHTQLVLLSDEVNAASASTITDAAMVQSLKSQLQTNAIAIQNAKSLLADPTTYTSQFTNDINTYASESNLSISGYDTAPNLNSSMISASSVVGVNSHFITITISNPVSYSDFLKFLELIETNVPKMQVTGINITPVSESSSEINVQPLTIEVFTR